MFENRVLKRISGSEREEVTGRMEEKCMTRTFVLTMEAATNSGKSVNY
jgi:hypothetical protein